MNTVERGVVANAISELLMRVDQLVEQGMDLTEAKRAALRGFSFSGNTSPFKAIIRDAVSDIRTSDLGPEARQVLRKKLYTASLAATGKRDSFLSRIAFRIGCL